MTLLRDGPCLPTRAACNQRFAYEWDEIGRLTVARRWDGTTTTDASNPSAELRYAYDASDARVLKTSVDTAGSEKHSVYVFGSLELRRTTWNGEDYARTELTEVPYLFAHGVRLGRVAYGATDLPSLASGRRRVFLTLPDVLGSTSIVVDKETSELVERATYAPFGNVESDYRPERWKSFREDYRFTGKEDDVEVGLQYFGKRYFAPSLGRWISPDPLAVHEMGADLNVYAYVHGRALRAVDPNGLDGLCGVVARANHGRAGGRERQGAAAAHRYLHHRFRGMRRAPGHVADDLDLAQCDRARRAARLRGASKGIGVRSGVGRRRCARVEVVEPVRVHR
ncbi:RHS repeat-associated core domain-containing protein, partial [bacterium]